MKYRITTICKHLRRSLITGLLCLSCSTAFAQVERTDSLKKTTGETGITLGETAPTEKRQHNLGLTEAATPEFADPAATDLPMTYRFRAPEPPTHIIALPFLDLSSSSLSLTGLADIRRASASYSIVASRWLIEAELSGEKYRFQQTAFNNLTLGGGLTYRLSDHWSASAFGTYSVAPRFVSMAAYPFISTSQFGGTINYENQRLSLRLGARRMFDPFARRWITEPIIAPGVRVGKVKMEMDMGPIVLDILRHMVEKSRANSATMPPMPVPPSPRGR